MTFDESEVRKAIEIYKPNNAPFEIRIIDGRRTASGYFTGADILVSELRRVKQSESLNVYITINTVKDECFSRKQRNKIIDGATPTTSDTDIPVLEFLFIDLDPRRSAGTSSSDEQLDLAKSKANDIYKYLQGRGWNDPVVTMSGNGVHLLYAIGLKNIPENVTLTKDCLSALGMLFSDEAVEVDLTTFNPSRIAKLPGTVARKGANTADRPHRMSKIVKADTIEQVDKTLLQSLVALLPKEEKPDRYNGYNPRSFDLEDWLNRHGIAYRQSSWNGGSKYVLDECLFDPSHKGKDAAIIQMPNGAIAYHCFHNSCSSYGWRDVRLKYEPDAYDKKYIEPRSYPNYRNPDYQAVTVQEKKVIDGEPVFYTTEQIRLLRTPPEEFIKTGIDTIDRRMRGLKKGFVTCISGLRGCGKSSIISQIAIETAGQGYRVALFSGELVAKHLYNWLVLQAAGKHHVRQTQYDNYFETEPTAEQAISKWLNEKIYVYNNQYGNDFSEIMNRLNECVTAHKVDLVILDNLMALNISMLEQDKFARQSAFVEALENFAKAANIHIIFVAHPRKSMGFLRLDDISGSNDIVNRVDNAFILHRVNEDFKRLSKQMFHWKDDSPLYRCNNVMEICKDRATGTQDEFIPLYFEMSCKRLKNSEYENKIYGWEEEEIGRGYGDEPF